MVKRFIKSKITGLFVILILLLGNSAWALPVSAAGGASQTSSVDMSPPIIVVGVVTPPNTNGAGIKILAASLPYYSPNEIKQAYNFPAVNAAGKHIAIIDAYGDPTLTSDVAAFNARFGLPAATLNIYYPDGMPLNNDDNWGTETALDVEWAQAMAPNATIDLIIEPDAATSSLLSGLIYATNLPVTPVAISMSFGASENDFVNNNSINDWETALAAARAKGITLLAATGDHGAYNGTTSLNINYPASSPSVIAVGGTTLTNNGSGYSETAWTGSGGGYSTQFDEPAYQSADRIPDPLSKRAIPDVSFDSDPNTGFYITFNDLWYAVGGTSAAAPNWAAIVADNAAVNAAAKLDNNCLYRVYGVSGNSPLYTNDMRDITSGNNNYYIALAGWDAVTGIGSPLVSHLFTPAAAQIRVETSADGSGTVVPAQNLPVGRSLQVYGIIRDQFGNYVGNPSDTTWSLTSITGGIVAGDLSPAADAKTTLTGHFAGTAVIHAVNGSFTGDSGTIKVSSSVAADFDGDGKTDVGVFHPADGSWWIIPSSAGVGVPKAVLGGPGDIPVPGDYDGDGKTDVAIFRPADGSWWVIPSSTGVAVLWAVWGGPGDIPVPGDYDGDGKTDVAIYHPADGSWWVIPSSTGIGVRWAVWGAPSDIPVPGDYDGDGKTDVAVFHPADGSWAVIPSSTGVGIIKAVWGGPGDIPVPGDYDGDGKTDVAIFHPADGSWWVVQSSTGIGVAKAVWGGPGDIPVPGDYDGDGKTDVAIFHPADGSWWVVQSSTGIGIPLALWGSATDIPLPGALN